MGRFSKLWGSLVGGIAGAVASIIIGALVGVGIGTCTDAAVVATCTVLGFSAAQVTTALTALGAMLGTYLFPANAP